MSSLRSAVIHLAQADPELRPHLLRLAVRGTFVDVKAMPDFLKDILKRVFRYGRQSVEVISSSTVDTGGAAFEGNRSVMIVVNLTNGRYKELRGSWGGGNPYDPQLIDQQATIPIPPNSAVISGERGGRGTFARVYVHPSNMTPLLGDGEAVVQLIEDALKALNAIDGLKGGMYRREYFDRAGIGEYALSNPVIQELIEAGMIKATRSGAMRTTTKGQNYRSQNKRYV